MASASPLVTCTVPASIGPTCCPKTISGLGARSHRSSSTIAFAPAAVSSPGWKRNTIVPAHASRAPASSSAAVSRVATCVSWPQRQRDHRGPELLHRHEAEIASARSHTEHPM
ncbi:hypothetical protein WSS_A14089 [Rhodococcus opacus M213]|uniref:Uncharacterized protein n=1 Tax=Rhodococcus opacus M213 TaxID=1129896 RepID=K8XKD4_RHOOP|nr:hypothetical protein WSS_A14089 [Rhodococcus opacus M213]